MTADDADLWVTRAEAAIRDGRTEFVKRDFYDCIMRMTRRIKSDSETVEAARLHLFQTDPRAQTIWKAMDSVATDLKQ